MHILFLSDNFPPEVNAPASRTFEHCREWVKAGHQVTVITGAPNFPQGRVYDGYRNRLWQREEMDGIRVIRVWTFITANEGFLRRILDYLSYMASATLAAPFVRKVDLVIGTSPQFFAACAGWLAAGLKRTPFVFELRDLWPESIKAVGAMKDSAAIRFFERLELFLYRRAAAVVSVTHSFRRNLIGRGIDPGKVHVVTNGVDLSRFAPHPKDPELVAELGLAGKFVAGYIGTHGMAHALETILAAAETIRKRPGGGAYRFILLGHGARKEELKAKAAAMGLDNLLFLDSVPKEEVPRYWSLLDVAIIHLRKTPLFETVIPSKLFEGMGMGIPVLHGVAGESAEIVRREEAGIPFEPENPTALVAGLTLMKEDADNYRRFRENALAAAPRYDRRKLAAEMLDILIDVVAKGEER
ncbi:MAG: glycosyltransferase family 4 protein [Deltaproteobacteria bacterium]|nr:glycosyltransferase family 4 protein [Deltaproteobacteria bacterium]